ncbi:Hypothetical protein GbCGDNIH5_1630 [Granulibacter bethesdensis]|nr:Hypothetical protein GbCGDNIH5_1630 [Granulibacter bethesdensis]
MMARSPIQVYLRARGGTILRQTKPIRDSGLSPRTRRNRQRARMVPTARGSISAHAEEPMRAQPLPATSRVYLRARGGTPQISGPAFQISGLSPRTRRNLLAQSMANGTGRSISAHAEEPVADHLHLCEQWVYLRARGGTQLIGPDRLPVQGLSPRTRRNHLGESYSFDPVGSISAHAEEPRPPFLHSGRHWVYLRARGGTSGASGTVCMRPGLSPRTRRNP